MNDIQKSIDSEENNKQYAVIENILMRTDWERVLLGDIFFDQSNVTFVPYGGFRNTAPIISGAAAVFGGLVGVVSNKLLDGTISDALPQAKKARTVDWGLSISDRAKKHGGAISLSRSSIQTYETEGGLVVESPGGKHIFGYAFSEDATEYSRLFREWYSDRLTSHPSAAKAGIGIEYPPPQVLLDSILENNPSVTGRALEVLAKDKDYMKRFTKVFATMGSKKRHQILEQWRDEPQTFRSEIARFLSAQGKGGDRLPIVSLAVLLLACAGIAYAVNGFLWLSGHENELVKGSSRASGLAEIGAVFFSVMAGISSVIGIGSWWEKRTYLQQLKAFDGGKAIYGVGDSQESVPIDKVTVSNQVICGQIWAGVLTGLVLGGGGGWLLSLIPSSVPGAEQRCATMGFWAFIGAYFSGAILSVIINAPKNWQKGKSMGAIVAIGVVLSGVGYLALNNMGLYDRKGDIGIVALPLVMGLILAAWVYNWMHNNMPVLFPFIGKAKKEADAELRKQMKGVDS